jgi:NDP-sugar pyrophosphorylase family protein
MVAPDFSVEQLRNVRLEGEVTIGSNSYIAYSTIRNYAIGNDCHIDSVLRMECRHDSTFGNGVMVATVNENGGRSIPIYNELTSQIAYIMAMMRNRTALIEELQRKVMARSEELRSSIGRIGDGATILGVKFIREVNISEGATIEGASHLENGTILRNATVGVDVRARDFIIDNDATVESGACIERCFVGEKSHLANGFTAADSLFFANCHCENGEAAAIFAGPFTVSHHKSSLLIAGIFSFFNAGSGTNQSNHLFKSGAVHQAVHLRGSKFGSNAYVMSPAIEGPYTVILGRHTRHHDTQDMPYSYLIEEDGHSSLVPAVALRSYGTVRDTEKWKSRDKRHLKRDNINFEEYNPYLTGKMLRGVDILTRLAEEDSEAKTYNYNRTVIKAPLLQRGIKLYNSAIAASIGMMLQAGDFSRASAESCGEWVDIAGQYLPHAHLEKILTEAAKSDTTLEEIKQMFDTIMSQYADMAAAYACNLLGNLTGRTPTTQDIEDAISASRNIHARLRETTEDDRMRDIGSDMMIGYGYDFREREEQMADFRNTR